METRRRTGGEAAERPAQCVSALAAQEPGGTGVRTAKDLLGDAGVRLDRRKARIEGQDFTGKQHATGAFLFRESASSQPDKSMPHDGNGLRGRGAF